MPTVKIQRTEKGVFQRNYSLKKTRWGVQMTVSSFFLRRGPIKENTIASLSRLSSLLLLMYKAAIHGAHGRSNDFDDGHGTGVPPMTTTKTTPRNQGIRPFLLRRRRNGPRLGGIVWWLFSGVVLLVACTVLQGSLFLSIHTSLGGVDQTIASAWFASSPEGLFGFRNTTAAAAVDKDDQTDHPGRSHATVWDREGETTTTATVSPTTTTNHPTSRTPLPFQQQPNETTAVYSSHHGPLLLLEKWSSLMSLLSRQSSSLSFASATECRLMMDTKVQNPMIAHWIHHKVPSLEHVLPLPRSTKNGSTTFTANNNHTDQKLYMLFNLLPSTNRTAFQSPWYCGALAAVQEGMDDDIGETVSTTMAAKDPSSSLVVRATRVAIRGGILVLSCPVTLTATKNETNDNNSHQATPLPVTHVWSSSLIPSPYGTVIPLYDVRLHQTCHELEVQEYQDLYPSSSSIATRQVGTPVSNRSTTTTTRTTTSATTESRNTSTTTTTTRSTNPQVGACLITRGDKSRRALHEWLVYHRLLGIHHVWIYLNEPWNLAHATPTTTTTTNETITTTTTTASSSLPNLPYVTYIPYNYWYRNFVPSDNGILIRWQVPMQMTCLWNAKRLGLDWIMTTDTDEFLDVTNIVPPPKDDPLDEPHSSWHTANNTQTAQQENQQHHPLPGVSSNDTTKADDSKTHHESPIPPLLEFLGRYNPHRVGALQMMSVPYGRHRLLEPEPNQHNQSLSSSLQMDQVWRNRNLWHTKWNRLKLLYSVPNALAINVHALLECHTRQQHQCPIHRLDPTSSIYLRHYRRGGMATTGIMFNPDFKQLVADRQLPQHYRTAVLEELHKTTMTTDYPPVAS